ncbi:MAG: polyprenyl synthetase family protein, partial [Armatimonadetes bacterium]|nr:polyprenyl synthetase family protein [Armatimonadota bacterium]
ERLQALLLSKAATPETLSRAMRYAVLNGGKRFRPLLCLGAAEAVGSTAERALDAACALEMVHCFSLIHDDLPALDNDDLRRGKPTCHVAFGEAIALLAGDALFALAFETLGGMDAPESARFRAMRALAAGTSGMVGGQTLDVECEDKPVEVDTVRWIHSRKTGALIAASCEIGALVGGGRMSRSKRAASAGRRLGLRFRLRTTCLMRRGTPRHWGSAHRPTGSAKRPRFRESWAWPSQRGSPAKRQRPPSANWKRSATAPRASACWPGSPQNAAFRGQGTDERRQTTNPPLHVL